MRRRFAWILGLASVAGVASLAILKLDPQNKGSVEQSAGELPPIAAKSDVRVEAATPEWAAQPIGKPHYGLDSAVYRVALSPDGRRVVSLGSDGLRLWDVASGALIRTLPTAPLLSPHSGATVAAWSSDGQAIALGTGDGTLMLLDVETDGVIWTVRAGDGQISALAFSHDGTRITVANAQDYALRILDRASGKEVARPGFGHRDRVTDLLYSTDDKAVISGSLDRTVRIWDAASGTETRPALQPEGSGLRHLALDPKGEVLAISSGGFDSTGSRGVGAVEFRELSTGKPAAPPLKGVGDTYGVTGMRFTEGGDQLMMADSFGGIALVEWRTGKDAAVGVLEHRDVIVQHTVFSPRADVVVTAGKDGLTGIWSVKTTSPAQFALKSPRHISVPGANPVLSADGSLVAYTTGESADAATVTSVGGDQTRLRVAMGDRVKDLAICDGNEWLAVSTSRMVRLWHIPTGRPAGTWQEPAESLTFSPDCKRLAMRSFGGITLLDRASGKVLARRNSDPPYAPRFNALAFSPTRDELFVAAEDNTIHRLGADRLQPIGEVIVGMGRDATIAISPDGQRLAVARSTRANIFQIVIVDPISGRQLTEPLDGLVGLVQRLAFTPDGRYLLNTGNDGVVNLWDSATSERLGRRKLWPAYRMRRFLFTRDTKHFWVCEPGTATRTDCSTWEVAIRTERARAPDGARQSTIPVPRATPGFAVRRLASAIDLGTGNLAGDAPREDVAVLHGCATRVLASQTGGNGPSKAFAGGAVSPDGRFATADLDAPQLAVFDYRTGKVLTVLELASYDPPYAFVPGNFLAVASSAGRIDLLDLSDPAQQTTLTHQLGESISILSGSERSGHVIAGGSEGQVWWGRIGKASADFRLLPRAHRGRVSCAISSSDGRLAATGAWDGTILLIDGMSGDAIGVPLQSHVHAVTAMAFSSDGRLLASGSADGSIRLWDVATKQRLTFALVRHADAVLGLAFDQTDRRLLSIGQDSTLLKWDLGALHGRASAGSP